MARFAQLCELIYRVYHFFMLTAGLKAVPAKDGGTVAAALDSSVSFAIASIEPILVPAQLLENKTCIGNMTREI